MRIFPKTLWFLCLGILIGGMLVEFSAPAWVSISVGIISGITAVIVGD